VERVLLEVRLAQVAGDLQGELLVVGEGVLPDELDDLLQLSLLVEHVDRPLALLRPVVGDFVLEPRVELILVQRVRLVPVDRREVAPFRQVRVERPERLHDAQRVLGDRLGEVTAGRRHRADRRDGPFRPVDVLEVAGALVELRETGGEVRRVPLLAGHLLQPGRISRIASAHREVESAISATSYPMSR